MKPIMTPGNMTKDSTQVLRGKKRVTSQLISNLLTCFFIKHDFSQPIFQPLNQTAGILNKTASKKKNHTA